MAHPATPAETLKSSVPGLNPDVFEPPRALPPTEPEPSMVLRSFGTGATRDQDTTKFDYEGFLSPLAMTRYAAYMHKNRVQSDGATRDSDNWQKGIPLPSYMKSLWRHLMTVWRYHREAPMQYDESLEEALCGMIFNTMGYLHEVMKAKGEED